MQSRSKKLVLLMAGALAAPAAILFTGCRGAAGGGLTTTTGGTTITGGTTSTPVPTTTTSTPVPTTVGTGGTGGATGTGTPFPPATSGQRYTTFFSSGTFANGTFSQSAANQANPVANNYSIGTVGNCGPTPTPIPATTPVNTPTPQGKTGTIYSGTYALSTGETGSFSLIAFSDGSSQATGSPAVDTSGCSVTFSTSGAVTITNLKVNGNTGGGALSFDNGTTGNISITSAQAFSFSKYKPVH